MSGVDPNLYEAAEIEGCGKIKKMLHITLPGIRGTIGVLFILGIGGLFSSGFDQIYLLRTPGNMALADTLDTFVVRVGLANGQFGYATAIGLLQGIVGLILVLGSKNKKGDVFYEHEKRKKNTCGFNGRMYALTRSFCKRRFGTGSGFLGKAVNLDCKAYDSSTSLC